jgi:hypothetical protein
MFQDVQEKTQSHRVANTPVVVYVLQVRLPTARWARGK